MQRGGDERTIRDQVIHKGEALCKFYGNNGSGGCQSKRKLVSITFSKLRFTNEEVHHLSVYKKTKKSSQVQDSDHRIIITRDNLCGVINDTLCTQPSSRSTVVQACPYIAVVTRGGTLEIQQPDGSDSSISNHDKWYKCIKQQLDFVHSWPVTLESSSILSVTGDSKAFLCLNRHTVSVVLSHCYKCAMFCTVEDCRFKNQSVGNNVRITVKRLTYDHQVNKCIVRACSGIANSFLRAVGYWPESLYITPDPHATYDPQPSPPSWKLEDTITALYNGHRPNPDTLGLSHSCLTQLGIKLNSQPNQPSWRDIAEIFGMSQDDVDTIVRWASSRYNVPRYEPIVLVPAVYLFYHWQYIYNRYGVGPPPGAPRSCTATELKSVLSQIGREDLVQLLDEWIGSITPI